MANADFCTNRIRFGEILRLFQQAGFDLAVMKDERWEGLPTPSPSLVGVA